MRVRCLIAVAGLMAVVLPAAAQAASLHGTLTRGTGKRLTYRVSDRGVAVNHFELQFGFSLTKASCPTGWHKTNAFFATAFGCDGTGNAQLVAGKSITGTVTTKFCLPAGTMVRGTATNTHPAGVPPQEQFTMKAPKGNCAVKKHHKPKPKK